MSWTSPELEAFKIDELDVGVGFPTRSGSNRSG
jgi:hypothetical protein